VSIAGIVHTIDAMPGRLCAGHLNVGEPVGGVGLPTGDEACRLIVDGDGRVCRGEVPGIAEAHSVIMRGDVRPVGIAQPPYLPVSLPQFWYTDAVTLRG